MALCPGQGFCVGDVLSGVYEIRGLIGTGGAGRVYEAYDRMLDRPVSIRTAEQRGPAGLLCAEARTLASRRAPGGLDVYAMGCHEGVEYVVMEPLFGLTLRAHMRARAGGRPFGLDEVLHILIGIARSLAVAHRGGTVHRQLTPDDIMLESGNRAVLLAVDTAVPGARLCHGRPAETPYIAPEARAGDEAAWHSPAVDIYALGVLAFELITGRPPRERDHVGERLAAGIGALAAGQPAELALHLARIVREMVAVAPARRPGDAALIALWLQALREAYAGRIRSR